MGYALPLPLKRRATPPMTGEEMADGNPGMEVGHLTLWPRARLHCMPGAPSPRNAGPISRRLARRRRPFHTGAVGPSGKRLLLGRTRIRGVGMGNGAVGSALETDFLDRPLPSANRGMSPDSRGLPSRVSSLTSLSRSRSLSRPSPGRYALPTDMRACGHNYRTEHKPEIW